MRWSSARGAIALRNSATAQFLELLRGLELDIDSETASRALTTTRDLAQAHHLSAYDATYLELAMRGGFTLATLDVRLRNAAKTAGVTLFA